MDPVAAAAVADAQGAEWGLGLAAAAGLTGDLDEDEECAQDAYAQALTAWATSGVPARPGAWLTMVARRRAVDLLRRRDILRAKLPLLVVPGTTAGPGEPGDPRQEAIPDNRLRLGFTCVHPALPPDARVALTVLTEARRDPRVTADGQLLVLAGQDRTGWDQGEISEGLTLVRAALRRRPYSRYALMAAIAATHATAPRWDATNWKQILDLYDELTDIWPSPIVALNRAVAVGHAHGPAARLAPPAELPPEPQLAGYHYLPATRAEFLPHLPRTADARLAYDEALAPTHSAT